MCQKYQMGSSLLNSKNVCNAVIRCGLKAPHGAPCPQPSESRHDLHVNNACSVPSQIEEYDHARTRQLLHKSSPHPLE